jgi:hypothetical protein
LEECVYCSKRLYSEVSKVVVKPRRRRRTFSSEWERKFWAAVNAKTPLGRINYLSDLANEEFWPSPLRDEVTHLTAELLLGRGTPMRRLNTWGKKFAKYRLKTPPPKKEITGSMVGLVEVITLKMLGFVEV